MSDYQGSTPPDPNQPTPPQQPDWSQPGQSNQPPPPPPPAFGQPPAYGQQPYGQPGYGQQGYGPPPANNLVWAILSTVLCCLPLGIASIVFASQVNGKYASGDLAGAQESARKAKLFAIWGAVAGVVVIVLYIGLGVLGATMGSTSP